MKILLNTKGSNSTSKSSEQVLHFLTLV